MLQSEKKFQMVFLQDGRGGPIDLLLLFSSGYKFTIKDLIISKNPQ